MESLKGSSWIWLCGSLALLLLALPMEKTAARLIWGSFDPLAQAQGHLGIPRRTDSSTRRSLEIERQERLKRANIAKTEAFTNVIKQVSESQTSHASLVKALTSVSELADLCGFIGKLGKPFIKALIPWLPDAKHTAIMNEFKKLDSKLDVIQTEIEELRKTTEWQTVKVQQAVPYVTLRSAERYARQMIDKSRTEVQRTNAKTRLVALCQAQKCEQDLLTLLNGIQGTDVHTDILKTYYQFTGGHRPKVVKLTSSMLQLVTGGLFGIMAYEGVRPDMASNEVAVDTTKALFDPKVKAMQARMKAILKRCVDQFPQNINKDINGIALRGGGNAQMSKTMNDRFTAKYDWLHFATFVYNPISGSDKHAIGGGNSVIKKFNHRGKNIVIFYRKKSDPVQSGHLVAKARQIVNQHKAYSSLHRCRWSGEGWGPGRRYQCNPANNGKIVQSTYICICQINRNAQDNYNRIANTLKANGIQTWGQLVIRYYAGPLSRSKPSQLGYTTAWQNRAVVTGNPWDIVVLVG